MSILFQVSLVNLLKRINLGLNKTASWVTFLYFVQPYSHHQITSSSSIIPSIYIHHGSHLSIWITLRHLVTRYTDNLHLSTLQVLVWSDSSSRPREQWQGPDCGKYLCQEGPVSSCQLLGRTRGVGSKWSYYGGWRIQAHVDSDTPGPYTVVFGLSLLLLLNVVTESLCHTTAEQKSLDWGCASLSSITPLQYWGRWLINDRDQLKAPLSALFEMNSLWN